MPVEFISATHIAADHRKVGTGFGGFDPDYTRRFVHALDDGGFDWTLVAYGSPSPDSLQLGQFVASNSERVKPMIAHRPGFQFPTQVAKGFAGLDRISNGRVGIHIISGGSDAEQRREGDYLTKEERYERSDEFIQILRKVWYEDGPISFAGKHYRFEDFQTEIKPVQERIQVSVGGSSPEAYDVGGRLGDVFGLWGEPLAETSGQIATVNAIADAAGRGAPTDELAWEKAHAILAQTQQALAQPGSNALARWNGNEPQNVGSVRLRAVAEKGDLHDRALWTPLAKELKGAGSTTALVGSYETVAQALLDYTEIGCDLLSIRGWDVYNDMVDYARYVLPLVRQELAHREQTGRAPLLNPDSRPLATI